MSANQHAVITSGLKRGRPAHLRTSTSHVIERGIPIPPRKPFVGAGRPVALDLSGLEVRDSVFLKAGTKRAVTRARVNAYNAAKRAEITVTVREVEGGVRVWRTA